MELDLLIKANQSKKFSIELKFGFTQQSIHKKQSTMKNSLN